MDTFSKEISDFEKTGIYKFEYDENSNWITKIMYNSEDVLISEKKRIIYYFD